MDSREFAALSPTQADSYLLALRASGASKSLYSFVRYLWSEVEPGTEFQAGWHLHALCDHLQALWEGKIPGNRLLYNSPPRTTKSTILSVMFPAWVWVRDPTVDQLTLSYSERLSYRDSDKTRALIKSRSFRSMFGTRVEIKRGHDRSGDFATTAGGVRRATSFLGATGSGGRLIVIDDAHDMATVNSVAQRTRVIDHYSRSIKSRENQPGETKWVAGMQRGHEHDLSSVLLDEGWHHLCFPQEYNPDAPWSGPTCLGFVDPRTHRGELLCPDRWPIEAVERSKSNPYDYAAQHNQNPEPEGGGLFRRGWFRWYDPNATDPRLDRDLWRDIGLPEPRAILVVPIPTEWARRSASWDIAASERARDREGAATTGQVWGVPSDKPAQRFLIDEDWFCLEHAEAKPRIAAFHRRHPQARPTLIEQKMTGLAILSDLSSDIPGLEPFNPTGHGDKINRANSRVSEVRSGNVFLPIPSSCRPGPSGQPWVLDFLAEVCRVPRGRWDRTDAMVQFLIWVGSSSSGAAASVDPIEDRSEQSIITDPGMGRVRARAKGIRARIRERSGHGRGGTLGSIQRLPGTGTRM